MKSQSLLKIKTAVVPIGPGEAGATALRIAKAAADEVILVGYVAIAEGEAISAGAQVARQVRKRLLALTAPNVRFKSTVIVSERPWKDLVGIVNSEKPDLFIVECDQPKTACGVALSELLSGSQCNVAIVRAAKDMRLDRTLIAVRGGPSAELALRVSLSLNVVERDLLHLSLTGSSDDGAFKGLKHILKHIPEVHLKSVVTSDISKTIFEEAEKYDLVVLGATTGPSGGPTSIGPVAEKLLAESPATVMIVRAQNTLNTKAYDERASAQAISILVDKWFAENTYHADEFEDLKQLMMLKEKQGLTISLALPALNEEKTVGKVISTIKKALMEKVPLIDEIVLIDSNSRDQTREIALELDVPVFIHQELLPEQGPRPGKGEALWKSLLVTRGDIIAWIDTDIVNIHPRFVYGIIGPLLLNPNVQFVKGFYRRPIRVGSKYVAGGGGRVTELTARPLLNLFYPELSGVIQPLSGEYAGRRSALEQATFFSGYGVETGLLIDIFEHHGLRAIAQVDLLERIHHNQELEALSKMSFAIIQTVLRKLESRYERAIIEDVNKTMKLVRYANGGYFLDVSEVAELERPPMISLDAYRRRKR